MPHVEAPQEHDRRTIDWDAYNLPPVEMDRIESGILEVAHKTVGEDATVVAALIEGGSPQADFGRTIETQTFQGYDFHTAMAPYEDRSLFLYTVDLAAGRIGHVKRVVKPLDEGERQATGMTGLEILDDRLSAPVESQRVTLDEVVAQHGIHDLSRTLNITTNMGTGRSMPSRENPYGLLSYKALFNYCLVEDMEALFAYLNDLAIKSLGRLGIEHKLLAGREFNLPLPDQPGEYDTGYKAVVIPRSRRNLEAFTTVDPDIPFTKLVASRNIPLLKL